MVPSHLVATRLLLLSLLTLVPSANAAVPTTAFGIIDDMGVGWNLGNSLESTGGETGWGNPKTTQTMIDTVRLAGFKTLRVPVRWDESLSPSLTISTAWMDRVEQVVNYGLNDGMYVIVNVHHNNGWEDPTTANEQKATTELTTLWKQIAARFQKYDNHVIFEVMNEPRNTNVGTKLGEDWYGNQTMYQVVNRMDAAAISTIRATGGNNAGRLVMMPGYAANNDSRMQYTVVPKDPMVAVSIHSYDPQDFCMTWPGVSTFTGTAFLDNMFKLVSSTFIQKGIPVILGEWASLNKSNLSERVKHASYFSKGATAMRIPTILWDNGSTGAGSNGMGYLNRSKPAWEFPTIIKAIVAGRGTAIQAKSSIASSEGLKISRTSDGIRFASPLDCSRYELTGVDGRTTVLPGGRTGFVSTGTLRTGVYVLRGESQSGSSLVQKILVDR